MKLYTVIMEYAGGTYISQVRVERVDLILEEWCNRLDVSQVQYLGEKLHKVLHDKIADKEETYLTPIEGVKNVWFEYIDLHNRGAFINVIQTDEGE